MPKVDIPGPYRVHFFSNERGEPPHVHVKREKTICKFWLSPLRLAENHGFPDHELRKIKRLIRAHYAKIAQAWDAHFKRLG